ncbi:hypothetical protein LVJ82_02780 [Vitreoscilla massiliensis]|uniref:J domain-containing protein n=1 Tax=Vitreoscilla massiliensis TaxID=1689272 RepID=A0ABY4E3H6_9NEIS|nr:hypothetical protein [Vitreoscilla massiliensis]UOO89930.1 hypothetical protein LVJ82_02780 [Vitreoscilla massiliensis]
MVNLYELLGISIQSTSEEIKTAIAKHYADSSISDEVLHKAKIWLLNPSIRSKYNEQLQASYPELFQDELPYEDGNLYEFLGIKANSKTNVIQEAIHKAQKEGRNSKSISLCKNFLLNKERKRKYDLSIKKIGCKG